jgi:O-succinylbenzoate synthase
VPTLESLELRLVALPLVRPFRTSMGIETEKQAILVRALTSDGEGWGECVASPDPSYSSEFNDSAWLAIRDHLAPGILGRDLEPEEVGGRLAWVRGHRMAKAAAEMAVLDASLRARGVALSSYLGGVKERIECGVSVGIADDPGSLVEEIAGYLSEGYRRVKLKIEPGLDVERVRIVREQFPDVPLSVDANAAYSLADIDIFRVLEGFDLMMIEQPLAHDDIVQHAELQRMIETPICLDESIESAAGARAAIGLGACRIINIKVGRVGGLLEARAIHDEARDRSIPVWCGGMLETGIGRAANLAIASLPGFTLPGDTSGSARYFREDLTEPFVVAPDGTLAVPSGPGLGVVPDASRLRAATRREETLRP